MNFVPPILGQGLMVETISVMGIDPAIDLVAAAAIACHRFLSHSWFAAATGKQPVRTLIARRADGRPVIALPIRKRSAWVEVPGSYWPLRTLPVAADLGEAEMASFLSSRPARKALGRVWRIGPVPADDPALAAIRRAAGASGWRLIERPLGTSFVLDIAAARADGPWPRTSTLRKNRFHEKHLAEHGVLEWRFVSGQEWSAAIFDDLAAIEAKSWHGTRRGTDTKFLDPAMRGFWERLSADPVQAERMRAALLYVGGAPAAFSFDLDVGTTKYAIANSYDPALAKHSPGKCLYYRNLVEAAERGIERVDWGAGDSGYKTTLGAVAGAPIVDCIIARGAAGAIGGMIDKARRILILS